MPAPMGFLFRCAFADLIVKKIVIFRTSVDSIPTGPNGRLNHPRPPEDLEA